MTSLEQWFATERFLVAEALALDEWRLDEWLDMLTDDIEYRIPIRSTIQDNELGIRDEPFAVHHIDEDLAGLRRRVERQGSGDAHAEIPHSRVRRFVSNVMTSDATDDFVEVVSNLLVFQGRRDRSEQYLSAQRRDVLRVTDGGLRLSRRIVILDHTVLHRPISILL